MNPFQSLIFEYLGIMRKMGRYKFSSDSLANFITFYKFAYCHINLVSISMGLFDLFKKDRGYEIHSLEFCEVGKDGKRDTRPSNKHYTDSRYIMPVVKMTSRIDRTVKIKVRITEPSGKTHTYDFDAPLKPVENMSAQFPWWGSEKRDHFTAVGTWRFDILDEKDSVVISAPLEIAPLEDIWESNGWIYIVSHFEFRNVNGKGEVIDDWNTRNFLNPKYIQMRCRYTSYSDVARKITYRVEIRNERTGTIKKFDHTVTLKPLGGVQLLQICGWGAESGTSYAFGTYTYTLYYKNREMGRGRFEVMKSPKERGWIEPLALVLHFYNTDEDRDKWVVHDCAMNIADGKIVEQKSFSFKTGAYKRLIAGFQWRSLEKGHPLKLTFKFYMEGNLVYTSVQDAVTNEPDSKDIFQQDFELSSSMRLEGPNGITSPFPAGRYEVKLYLKTEELDEHFVMQRTLDVR